MRSCIVYTWDHKSSAAFWAGMKVYVFPAADGGNGVDGML